MPNTNCPDCGLPAAHCLCARCPFCGADHDSPVRTRRPACCGGPA